MTSDDLWIADDGNFDEVKPASAVARTMGYIGSVIGILVGPAMVVVLLLVGAFEWPSLIGGVAILLTVGLLSLASMVSTTRMQRRVERLRRDGRAATAEVIDSRSVSLGEESGVEVTLQISGAGFAPFPIRHRGMEGAIDRLGTRFPIIVDPRDHAYMIVR